MGPVIKKNNPKAKPFCRARLWGPWGLMFIILLAQFNSFLQFGFGALGCGLCRPLVC